MTSLRTLALALFLLPLCVQSQELLLYGGTAHKDFIGCIGCNNYSTDSICNKYGKGSKYSSESIFNKYGTYGSKYSSSSPWNKYSSDDSVPVLVDKQGNFFGYFTINKYRSQAATFAKDLSEIYEVAESDLEVVRNLLCK